MEKKRVTFKKEVTIHKMICWSYAYHKARNGDMWLLCAIDRGRFKSRILDIEKKISSILSPLHRKTIVNRNKMAKLNYEKNNYITLRSPLNLYQKIQFKNTVTQYPYVEDIFQNELRRFNLNFDETKNVHENLINAGSIGYNHLIQSIDDFVIKMCLQNHNIEEKFTWAYVDVNNFNLINKCNYYHLSMKSCQILSRKHFPSNRGADVLLVVHSICSCSDVEIWEPISFKCTECLKCWTPKNAFLTTQHDDEVIPLPELFSEKHKLIDIENKKI